MTATVRGARRRVTRRFGAVLAVDNLSLAVGHGETIALLGPNGAGKTTTISMLLGLSAPDSGSIEIFGVGARDRPRRTRMWERCSRTAA